MRKSISQEVIEDANIYQCSESIVKAIIDRLIILSVRKSYSKKIESDMRQHCFDFMKAQIDYIFESYYISHTKQPINKEATGKNELLWKTIKPKRNTWIEIMEPECFEIDRYEGSNIKFKEIEKSNRDDKQGEQGSQKNKNSHKSHFKRKSMIEHEIKLNNEIRTDRRNKTNIKEKESNKNLEIIINKKEVVKTEKNDNKEEKKENQTNEARNKKIMFEFPSEDIPNIEEEFRYDKYDLPNAETLRKEFQESLIKKEEERKKQIKLEREKEQKKRIIITDKKDKKLIDTNRLTFDSNGKIISFRQYRLDNLKDFFIPKNFIKDVKKSDNSNLPKNNKLTKTPKKLIIKEEVIKNIEKYDFEERKINPKSLEKIIPSGSNFKIMAPDIGVIIKENGKSKEGPKNFSKYFKKYSLIDYNQMLSDNLPNWNKNLYETSLGIKSIQSQRNMINYNNPLNQSKEKLNFKSKNESNLNSALNDKELSAYNPLLSSSNIKNTNENDNNNFNNFNTLNTSNNQMISSKRSFINFSRNNSLLSTYNNNNSSNLNNNLNTINYDKSISMKKGIGSLKLELDSLKDLNENLPMIYNNSLTTRINDIIGNRFKRKNNSQNPKNIKIKNIFGDFNKRILTNKRWGEEFSGHNNNTINTVYSKHQTKMQVLRELGSTIFNGLKIKLPRNRKVNLNSGI